MQQNINLPETCPCLRHMAKLARSCRTPLLNGCGSKYPVRITSSHAVPLPCCPPGMGRLRLRRRPSRGCLSCLTPTRKVICPLPRGPKHCPGPAHYHLRQHENGAYYCSAPSHRIQCYLRSNVNYAPFLQSAERFPPGPPFRAPAPNTYFPRLSGKNRFSGLLAGYAGNPTTVNVIDRSCDLNTVHLHCVMCPPLGLYSKQIGFPLHVLYPECKTVHLKYEKSSGASVLRKLKHLGSESFAHDRPTSPKRTCTGPGGFRIRPGPYSRGGYRGRKLGPFSCAEKGPGAHLRRRTSSTGSLSYGEGSFRRRRESTTSETGGECMTLKSGGSLRSTERQTRKLPSSTAIKENAERPPSPKSASSGQVLISYKTSKSFIMKRSESYTERRSRSPSKSSKSVQGIESGDAEVNRQRSKSSENIP